MTTVEKHNTLTNQWSKVSSMTTKPYHPQGKYDKGLTAINKLKQLDKEDKRAIEVLVKFAILIGERMQFMHLVSFHPSRLKV